MAFLSHRLYKIIWEHKGQHHSRHRKPQRPPKRTHMFGTLTSIEECGSVRILLLLSSGSIPLFYRIRRERVCLSKVVATSKHNKITCVI